MSSPGFTGQHEAGSLTVRKGHREASRHDDERNHAADACVDRQEQNATPIAVP